MQGRHIYQPSSAIVDMESLVPSNHFLRRVDRVIDLSFIRELTQRFYCEGKGRPSIDPELFFRLVLVGYFYNIKSDRQLCEEIQYNLAYRLFCKIPLNEEVPDHSSLSRIRDRLGEEVFEQFFRKVVKLCEEHDLVKGKSLMTDATLIEASASIDSMKLRDGQVEEEPHKGNGLNPPKSRKLSNKTHQSATDPDASLAFKEGTPRSLKYKNHVTIDSAKRVIVDAYVTTGANHESQDYIKRIEHIGSTFNWNIKEVIADRAYGSGDNLQTLKNKGIKTYIPLFSDNSGMASQEGFTYEAVHDRYRCPAGKYLIHGRKESAGRRFYTASMKDCSSCHLKNTCLTSARHKKYGKHLYISTHQQLYDEVEKQMETPDFLKKMTERFWKMEGIMAEAKNCHGLKRVRYRSRLKVQIQAYLISTVQNIKRLVADKASTLRRLSIEVFYQLNGKWSFQ